MNIRNIKNEVKKTNPLVHCITNPISINQCANAILSLGAKPIMAQHPLEVAQITKTASSALYNLGNITDDKMSAISASAYESAKLLIPSVLDVVGVSCSDLRRNFAGNLLENLSFSVIKGNYSEIKSLFDSEYKSIGVDADRTLNTKDITQISEKLAKKYKTVIMASGKTDIVTNGKKTIYISNGTPDLAKITGTGCMLGAICSVFLSVEAPLDASVYSCAFLGICAQMSDSTKGYGTYLINLIDNISTLSDEDVKKHIKLEMVKDE